jgi:hypothetical protein
MKPAHDFPVEAFPGPKAFSLRRVRRALDEFAMASTMLPFVAETYGPDALEKAWEEFSGAEEPFKGRLTLLYAADLEDRAHRRDFRFPPLGRKRQMTDSNHGITFSSPALSSHRRTLPPDFLHRLP